MLTFIISGQTVKRHIRNHGQRRRQLQDEIQSLFSLPTYWRSTSRSSGEKRAKRQLQQAQSRLDPTHSADSMFLLNLYNDMNDDYDPVLYSKAALDLRKRRSKGKHFYVSRALHELEQIYIHGPLDTLKQEKT